jgi:hypothetical protein
MADKSRVNMDDVVYGKEPVFDDKPANFVECLNWYSRTKDYKDSRTYLVTHMKLNKYDAKMISKISSVSEWEVKNIGYIVRMISRGYQPTLEQISWIDIKINELFNYVAPVIEKPDTVPTKPKVSIQDKIYLHCTEIINTIEDAIDIRDYTLKVYEFLSTQLCKAVHIKQIIDHFKPLSVEVKSVITGNDDQLIEGYSNYNKTELKKLSQFLQLVLSDCNKFTTNAKVAKVPRKKKVVPLSKKILKLVFKKDDPEYKIVSVKPESIIGCQSLWVFNTKTRKLGVYVAKDESGLSVKGTTIENYDETLSINKIVRKPLDVIPDVVQGKKTTLKKVMSGITSVASPLNGRINADVVLLTTIK